MRDAALPMEPVPAMSSSKSALPGPKAISFPQTMRKRGCNAGNLAGLFFLFMAKLPASAMDGWLTRAKVNLIYAGGKYRCNRGNGFAATRERFAVVISPLRR